MMHDEIAARLEIAEVLARYCRGVDRMDVNLLRSVYHEDSTDDHTTFKGSGWEFAAYIVETCRQLGGVSQHNITNSRVELHGGDVAHADTYYVTHHAFGDPETGENMLLVALGRYLDRLEKRAGAWKIKNRLVTIDWSSYTPAPPAWPGAKAFPVIGGPGVDPMYALFPSKR
jgi:hypothetical protein